MLFTVSFWKDATERAVKSLAQAVVLVLGGDAVDVWHVNWQTVVGAGLGGALLSLMTSLASVGIANRGTASLTAAVEPAADA